MGCNPTRSSYSRASDTTARWRHYCFFSWRKYQQSHYCKVLRFGGCGTPAFLPWNKKSSLSSMIRRFLHHAGQITAVLSIVRRFGRFSEISVQPAQSELILHNTAVAISDFEGIPVLSHGQTTRYIGYQVGLGIKSTLNGLYESEMSESD